MSEQIKAWRSICLGRHLNDLQHSLCKAITEACDRVERLTEALEDVLQYTNREQIEALVRKALDEK